MIVENERNSVKIPKLAHWEEYTKMTPSFVNTPDMCGIYVAQKALEHMDKTGGIEYYEELNLLKSKTIYDVVDNSKFEGRSKQFRYVSKIDPKIRSSTNVCFYVDCEDESMNDKIENDFIIEARAAGFLGVGGHRAAGGLRASVYNAVPLKAAQEFAEFMKDF